MNQLADRRSECPKCGTVRPAGGDACPRCGLARARFATFAAGGAAPVPPALAAKWDQVVANWNDPKCHDEFIAQGIAQRAFPFLARCYRDAARERVGCDVAAGRLEDIAKRAEAAILTTAKFARDKGGDERKEPFRGLVLLMALLVAVIAAGTVYAMMSMGGIGYP